jgi:hypothetical protein
LLEEVSAGHFAARRPRPHQLDRLDRALKRPPRLIILLKRDVRPPDQAVDLPK